MPKNIYMTSIQEAGRELFKLGGYKLPGAISVEMYGQKMVIKENGTEVFTMKKVQVEERALMVDYPRTKDGEGGRGWGVLGMLIALYHGVSKGCNRVVLGTQIEQTRGSLSFWTKFGIARMDGTPMQTVFDRGIGWVLANCRQNDRVLTEFVLRDHR